MNFIKTTIAAASIAVCCMGNQMPAKAFIFGDIPQKDSLATMTAKLACRVRSGKISASVAATAGVQTAVRLGYDVSLLQDPDVMRWTAERMSKYC